MLPLSPLASRIRSTLRRSPVSWAAACGVALRPYQVQVARAVKESILHRLGLTFVVVLPRQSGKNELQSHLFAWLLFRFQCAGGRIVSVSPTFKPQVTNSMDRVRRSLDACLGSRRRWHSASGYIFCLGEARLQFFSGDPSARVVGATADLLLSVDEAQEVSPAKFDKDFDPMTASTNATRIFWGTAWTSDTLLERERRIALRAQAQDGIRRLFHYTADDVRSLVPAYGAHVDRVISLRGRDHPLVRTQYFCETLDSRSGMFNPARIALLSAFTSAPLPPGEEVEGFCALQSPPTRWRVAGQQVAFLIDVAGVDEARLQNSQAFELNNPGRDATALSIVAVDLSSLPDLLKPTYHVVSRRHWVGESHLAILGKLKALADEWNPQQIVIDATGVGEGLCSMLTARFDDRVIPIHFTQQEKSELGWRFISIIETGRFRDHVPDEMVRQQYTHCIAEMLPGPGKLLRWGVPEGTRSADGDLVHDDFIVADSFTAVLDRLEWKVGTEFYAIEGEDPLLAIPEDYF